MTDDLAFLDATAQAELVARGDAHRARAGRRGDRAHRARRPRSSTRSSTSASNAHATKPTPTGGLPVGPLHGVPFLVKDAVCHTAGDPFHCGMRALKARGLDRARRHLARGALPRRRLRVRRQDQHARARDELHHRAARVRRDAQPVGPHAQHRAVRAAGRRPRSRPGWSRSRTATTWAARSASPRRCAASSA